MSYSHRIFIYGPVGLLLLIVILYSVFWRVQADTLSARLDRVNGGEVIPGVKFAFAEKSVGGFPFRLDAVLSDVSFSYMTPKGDMSWRTEKLALHSLSYGRNRFLFEVTGLQTFTRPPETPAGAPRIVLVTPALARASAILRDGKLARFDLDLLEVQAKDATTTAAPNRDLSADRAQLHLLARADNTIDIALKIDNAHIGAGYASLPAEIRLPLIDGRGKLTESGAFGPLASGEISIADAGDAWRTHMGVLAVSDLALNWPDAHADLKGELMLNADGSLAGTLKGMRVEKGASPVEFGLRFAGGDIRPITASARARSAP